jgi:hypothetical protein
MMAWQNSLHYLYLTKPENYVATFLQATPHKAPFEKGGFRGIKVYTAKRGKFYIQKKIVCQIKNIHTQFMVKQKGENDGRKDY